MSDYRNQQNYWAQAAPPPNYNFDSSGFGQPNQQFEFQTYNDQQSVNYSAYTQKSFLDPTESVYTGDMFGQDNFPKGIQSKEMSIIICYTMTVIILNMEL